MFSIGTTLPVPRLDCGVPEIRRMSRLLVKYCRLFVMCYSLLHYESYIAERTISTLTSSVKNNSLGGTVVLPSRGSSQLETYPPTQGLIILNLLKG